MTELHVDDALGMAETLETLGYYFNMRLVAQKMGKDAKVPESIEKIIEIVKTLPPKPEINNWTAQATGKLTSQSLKAKPKPKAAAENGDGSDKKPRGQWTEENKAELVKLVESEDYRKEKLGSGSFVWAAMARHFGFSKAGPLQRQYNLMTGKEVPGARPKKEPASGAPEDAAEPAAKKAKVEEPAAAAAGASTSAAWSAQQGQILVMLVEDEKYRKEQTGKSSLKWSRIAEHLGRGKKECKKKYTALTGKSIED